MSPALLIALMLFAFQEETATVKVATWNVENFFDAWDDPYRRDEITTPSFTTDARKERLAQVVRALDADILCLQEVENRFLLEEWVKEFLPDAGYQVVLLEGNDSRGIDVALLSRIQVGEVATFRHLRFTDAAGKEQRFRRDLLRVSLGPPFSGDIYVVHLKSQHGDEKADLVREAEARAIAEILSTARGRRPGLRAMVAGDFNEVPEKETLKVLLDSGLIDACAASDGVTYNREPYLSRIDYLLLTPALATGLIEASVVDDLPGMKLREVSDHFPVVGIFTARGTASPVR